MKIKLFIDSFNDFYTEDKEFGVCAAWAAKMLNCSRRDLPEQVVLTASLKNPKRKNTKKCALMFSTNYGVHYISINGEKTHVLDDVYGAVRKYFGKKEFYITLNK